jgi:ketosteroid isomerase-like protein
LPPLLSIRSVPSNVDVVRRGFEHFAATGELLADIFAPDFVWDMSLFRGWPEELLYHGIDGARNFLRDWTAAWDDWELALEAVQDSGDQVVTVVRQTGLSKATKLPVEMSFGMLWTLRDGKQTRMVMYADPAEAIRAAGLSE